MVLKCKKHPKYKAIQAPRVDCPDCVRMYQTKALKEVKKKS